jgi:N-acetylglucosaminyldiphosphoundecaprenol N-acetyl-beta-D-mannosaminyltransferase
MDKLLDVKIDNLTKTEIRQKVKNFLIEDGFHQIATINPEFILEAQENSEFKNILNSCDLNIADGFGIKLAFWRYGKNLKYRMAGIDLMMEILQIANAKKLSVFLAAKNGGLSSWEEIRDAILKIYPDLEIYGSNLTCHSELVEESNLIRSLRFGRDDKIDSDIVFCNFGAPYQETFLRSLKSDRIRLAMGVGGSFDYLTGQTPRAPQFLRQTGLEWLWRLILQPKRWKRILNSIVIFPVKILFTKK